MIDEPLLRPRILVTAVIRIDQICPRLISLLHDYYTGFHMESVSDTGVSIGIVMVGAFTASILDPVDSCRSPAYPRSRHSHCLRALAHNNEAIVVGRGTSR